MILKLRSKLLLCLLVAICVVTIIVAIYFAVRSTNIIRNAWEIDCTQTYDKYTAGVVTNGIECAKIGSDILRKGGSAADAAIAALFCEGVAQPQSMGLGGGFLLTIYTRATGKVETLNARETAPAHATKDMFKGNADLSKTGALSVAVPGELRGYWALHQRYGKLNWKDLIEPTIKLCRQGNIVTPYLATVFKTYENVIFKEPSLREILIDPATNETWLEGQRVKRLKLAETLQIIANEGAEALYNGTLTKKLVNDIKELGGIITEEDMLNYQPQWSEPIKSKFINDMTLYSTPIPGSGPILTFILNLLDGFIDINKSEQSKNWQRIVESFKFAYGKRTEMGDIKDVEKLIEDITSKSYALKVRSKIYDNQTFQDPEYYGANYSQVEDHGTAHISVLASNGDAVSVTSTINLILGSKIRSKSTGIILNDEMDDFSAPDIKNAFGIPPSPANFIAPGKRPLSSMCPSIIVDQNGEVRLIVGAAGGTKITTSTALVAIRNSWFNKPLENSIRSKRLHHQLFPMAIQYESDFDKSVVNDLSKLGHKSIFLDPKDGFAAVTGIARQCNTLFGQYDRRRQGSVDLF